MAVNINVDYVKSVHGICSLLDIVLGFVSLFVCNFIWHLGHVFLQFYFSDFPGQLFVCFVLFVTWVAVIVMAVFMFGGRDLIKEFGPIKSVAFHGVCFVLLCTAGAVELHYSHLVSDWDHFYRPRIAIIAFLIWVLCILHFVQACFVLWHFVPIVQTTVRGLFHRVQS